MASFVEWRAKSMQGSTGINDGEMVLAFGDFNDAQFLDVMTFASDQQTLSVYLAST
ncbi:hypothetical protein FA95DRAFT_1608007 [Auriscalpium vulgare]|uniref:Uncharacterized protein n=1 Tax=Auriscalpium vulgare TaxID=40419 RepID=A0ACB8RMH0_9AGAM|nr:hypothetical protein FA95DRAFT_1608007 [Auriscalpium vulgare]